MLVVAQHTPLASATHNILNAILTEEEETTEKERDSNHEKEQFSERTDDLEVTAVFADLKQDTRGRTFNMQAADVESSSTKYETYMVRYPSPGIMSCLALPGYPTSKKCLRELDIVWFEGGETLVLFSSPRIQEEQETYLTIELPVLNHCDFSMEVGKEKPLQ